MGKLTYEQANTGHGRYKGILFNYDAVREESEDRCLFCLTKQQVAYLLASLDPARWKTRWYSPTDQEIDEDWLDAVFSALEVELMTDHCDLATDITNILTQITNINTNITTINTDITTINNNLTVIENNVTNIDIEVKNVITQNTNINIVNVITTFVSFAAHLDDNSNTEMYARYNALCSGLNDWVYTQCYRVASANGVSSIALDAMIAAMTIGVNLIEGLVHTDNPGAYSATDLANAFTSATDMDAVICYMVTYLAQLPVTFDNFKSCLTSFIPANAYQTTIAVTLQAALLYYDAFTAFVMNAQSEFEIALAANPTDFNCLSCGVAGWCSIPQTWDFAALNLLPWTINRGELTSGVGVVGVQIPGDLNFGVDMSIFFPTPCVGLATHHLEISHAKLAAAGNSWALEYYYLLAGVPTIYNASTRAQTLAWPNVDVDSVVIPTPPGGVGIYRIRFYNNTLFYGNATSQTSQAAKISKIRFLT